MTLSFSVMGNPVPQGSKTAFLHKTTGRVVMMDQRHAPLRSWRDSMASAAAECSQAEQERYPRPMAVTVSAMFRLARPKTQTKAQRIVRWVTTKPDVDKLGRALLDALTASRVFDDDSQVASLWLTKVYADDDDSLGVTVVVGTSM